MPKIIDDNNENRKSIEKALIKHKDGATINQISKDLNLSWITVKKHLERLNAIGRTHVKKFGNNEIYFLNGEGKWKKQIELSPNHTLFLDTLVSPFNEPFLRIKETKVIDGKWQSVGNIIITKEKLPEVIDFLKQLKSEISG
jgi:predicted ArsR family transcriptional regulator